jgi:hypothetical protein
VPDSGPNFSKNPNGRELRAKRAYQKARALKHPRQPRKKLQLETKRKNRKEKQLSKPIPKHH